MSRLDSLMLRDPVLCHFVAAAAHVRGTGKSTLLDAYIALMMPSDTPFNGASNDAVGGRARSAEQRNLLSYLRGRVDTTADDAGRSRPKVLREPAMRQQFAPKQRCRTRSACQRSGVGGEMTLLPSTDWPSG